MHHLALIDAAIVLPIIRLREQTEESEADKAHRLLKESKERMDRMLVTQQATELAPWADLISREFGFLVGLVCQNFRQGQPMGPVIAMPGCGRFITSDMSTSDARERYCLAMFGRCDTALTDSARIVVYGPLDDEFTAALKAKFSAMISEGADYTQINSSMAAEFSAHHESMRPPEPAKTNGQLLAERFAERRMIEQETACVVSAALAAILTLGRGGQALFSSPLGRRVL